MFIMFMSLMWLVIFKVNTCLKDHRIYDGRWMAHTVCGSSQMIQIGELNWHISHTP